MKKKCKFKVLPSKVDRFPLSKELIKIVWRFVSKKVYALFGNK